MPAALDNPTETHFDVLVIGAGLAGICTALLIRKRSPKARVAIVEQETHLPDSGNSYALSGVSSIFMSMALDATDLLTREHLPRHGEHLWFAADAQAPMSSMSEVGADEFASHPAYHVDNRRLAHSLLQRAREAGVQVLLGCEVLKLRAEWPESSVQVRCGAQSRSLHARWIVDAAGRAGLFARQLDLRQELDTPASWNAVANWSGILPFERVGESDPRHHKLARFARSRESSTHHFHGPHWRASLVPHAGGGASLHLNMDWEHYAASRAQSSPIEVYSRFLRSSPGLRELLHGASIDAASFQSHREQDWTAKERCRRGWFLVGEAAGTPATVFGERFDSLVRTIWNAAEVIGKDLARRATEAEVVEMLGRCNMRERQYDRADRIRLRSTTRSLCGDAALCSVAYSLRRSVQSLEMQRIVSHLSRLSILSWHSLWQGRLRGTVYARLTELARKRRINGHYANRNAHWQLQLGPGEGTLRPLLAAGWQWLQLEYASLREGLSPVPGDSHESPGHELQRRAAEFRATLGTAQSPASSPKRIE